MDNLEYYQELIDLLKQKRDKIREMLHITQTTHLGETADSSIIYIELIEKRETLLNEIKNVQSRLTSPLFVQLQEKILSDEVDKDVVSITSEIEYMIHQIIELDKENEVKVQRSMCGIKERLKDIKTGRTVSNRYQQNNAMFERTQFDKKK